MNNRLFEALGHAKTLSEIKKLAPMLRNCPKELREGYHAYRKECYRLTRKAANRIEGYKGRPRKHCIDHKVSILYGFLHNIPAEDLCRQSNLRVISSVENNKKRNGCIFEGTEMRIDERTRRYWEIR